ncbi:MAG: SDR family NAD(P)-dependent oxidoreductase [Polyangiaceae bacterium]|nr:SDR family NAD(P)-dependent oxidoreductase [Polyangiaceae bacterium]
MAEGWATAIVTGASSGIGRALALELARTGTKRIVLAARREALLASLAEEIRDAGAEPMVEVLDVGDADRCAERLRKLDEDLGGFDLVVANAGVGAQKGADPIAWETLRGPLHINLCGAAATLTGALGAMVARRRGHLVGIGSLASYGPLPEAAAYCTPKAGLAMLLECLALDLAGSGVSVTHVRLGFVKTPMTGHATHPMPQLLEAPDAARRIVAGLRSRPREIVLPRALGAAARVAALAPRRLRDLALGTRRATKS